MATDVVQTTPTGVTFSERVKAFVEGVNAEMRKVTWPDRTQLKDTTIKIIIFVLLLGAVIGIIDLLLEAVLVRGIPSLFTGTGH